MNYNSKKHKYLRAWLQMKCQEEDKKKEPICDLLHTEPDFSCADCRYKSLSRDDWP